MVRAVYSSQYIQNQGTFYTWVTNNIGTLVRYDDDSIHKTTVYKYDTSSQTI